ncbi:sodium- and chloride-dependent glycine transporter 1-like isoform X2 [Mizuhopecten yessoensis]|uniref:sodium- and chloride-dependent glycine transporter 1-like isoform X2 n=1 Tax=Mizuhopecten yessoensis TaxID=6573 RepID=UPI000B458CA7|nr:sodium- and chloride-dependent glycine transporter 1-like isoform X2 [Mizuhopecten yessoensis]
MGEKKSDQPRQAWGSQIEFILTCVGYAVGLGNVWRFPYLCFKNGGGAFLIPYVICLLLVGIPIFYLELSLGQFASLGPLKVWTINPALKGLGMCLVIIPAMISIYYNVVIAYCIYYFFASMTSALPWVTCDNSWNTCDCHDSTLNMSLADPWQGSRPECLNYTSNTTTSASEEYFFEKVLGRSGGIGEPGNVKWDVMLCNLLGWFIVFLVLSKGIQSLGKVVYFSAIFPYVLLTVLLVRGLTLDGYYDGIMFYITPDWDKVANANVWSDAATQIFFSLSACQGGLIAMASYNKFTNLTLRDALLVPVINCLTSFYAGFAIFSVLGFMAYSKGVSVEDVATGGPGLVFIVYPEGLSQMPVPTLWAILFFFMMMTLGFSSQFSIVEAVITGLMDQFSNILNTKWRKIGFRFLICLTGFLLGLPMVTEGGYYMFEMTDHFISGFPMLFIGLAELIAINFIYGFWNFKQDIEMMLGQNTCITISFLFFGIMWCFVSPICLAAVIVAKCIDYEKFVSDGYVYPDWAQAIGWLIVAGALCFMPIWYIIYMCKNGLFTLCKRVNTPTRAWGPALPENRTGPRYSQTVEVTPVIDMDVEGGLYRPKGKVISYEPGEPRGYANGNYSQTNTVPSAPDLQNGGLEPSYEHGYINSTFSHPDESGKKDDSTKF